MRLLLPSVCVESESAQITQIMVPVMKSLLALVKPIMGHIQINCSETTAYKVATFCEVVIIVIFKYCVDEHLLSRDCCFLVKMDMKELDF